jgi:hypothetical protein
LVPTNTTASPPPCRTYPHSVTLSTFPCLESFPLKSHPNPTSHICRLTRSVPFHSPGRQKPSLKSPRTLGCAGCGGATMRCLCVSCRTVERSFPPSRSIPSRAQAIASFCPPLLPVSMQARLCLRVDDKPSLERCLFPFPFSTLPNPPTHQPTNRSLSPSTISRFVPFGSPSCSWPHFPLSTRISCPPHCHCHYYHFF